MNHPYPPGWPPQGIIHPDGESAGWEWYCPRSSEHAFETGLPDERTALRYLIAHLDDHPARDARQYLVPARARLAELVRVDAAARVRLRRGVTVDLLLLWAEVEAGDRVLIDDGLVTVDRAEITDKPWGDGGTFPAVDVTYTYQGGSGRQVVTERHGDRLTAVRRTI